MLVRVIEALSDSDGDGKPFSSDDKAAAPVVAGVANFCAPKDDDDATPSTRALVFNWSLAVLWTLCDGNEEEVTASASDGDGTPVPSSVHGIDTEISEIEEAAEADLEEAAIVEEELRALLAAADAAAATEAAAAEAAAIASKAASRLGTGSAGAPAAAEALEVASKGVVEAMEAAAGAEARRDAVASRQRARSLRLAALKRARVALEASTWSAKARDLLFVAPTGEENDGGKLFLKVLDGSLDFQSNRGSISYYI